VFLNSHLLTEVERVCHRVAVVDRGAVVAQGSIDQMLGARSVVRRRVENLGALGRALLERFGTVTHDGTWYAVDGARDADVPDLVAALVGADVRIHAVESTRATLEERFLQLLLPADGVARDRVA
jgi:ABC-2 type transport system ATP-binding protein